MATSPDKQSLRTFLADTVTLLCKNFLHFESEFSVEGLIGITLDQKDVFLISIHETVKSPDAAKVPALKSTEAESVVAKSAVESNVTAACNVTLAQSVTSAEDAVQNTAVGHDVTDVEMLHDTDIARQPVVLLPDDVRKGDNSTADVKLEVGSVRSIMPDQTHDGQMYDRDLSSSAERTQNCAGLPLAFDLHTSLETVISEDSKTFKKLDYSEKSSSSRSLRRSSVAKHSMSSDSHKAGFSQGGDFEVIEIKEESLSDDEFTVSNPDSQLGLPLSQACSQDFSIQGMSSAMDTAMDYSYWEGNPISAVQAMNQSTVSLILLDLKHSLSSVYGDDSNNTVYLVP